MFKKIAIASLIVSGATFALWGCGNTGGGGSERDFDGGSFDGDSAGTIELDIIDDDLNVADVSGFHVRVRNSSGQGVPNVTISCDTEAGLALLEPSNGTENTDGDGNMSGRLGCAKPGSYLIGCRLPNSGAKRTFETVICSGPTPTNFTGFAGAGGGGLGGDSVDDETAPQITDVLVFDDGSVSEEYGSGDRNFEVDTSREDCDDTTTVECEAFPDTLIGVDVENGSRDAINFTTYSYRVLNVDGSGGVYQAGTLAISNADEVPARTDGPGTKRFIALFAKAVSTGANCAGSKRFLGDSQTIPGRGASGFKTVEIKLFGTSERGEDITLTRRVGISFDGYNRCE